MKHKEASDDRDANGSIERCMVRELKRMLGV